MVRAPTCVRQRDAVTGHFGNGPRSMWDTRFESIVWNRRKLFKMYNKKTKNVEIFSYLQWCWNKKWVETGFCKLKMVTSTHWRGSVF